MTSFHTKTIHRSRIMALAACATALAVSTLLTGCTGGLGTTSSSTLTASGKGRVSGNVHGGQQPVSGAAIQIYTVGTSGLMSASTAIPGATATTDQYGNFNIDTTTAYNCNGATQVYMTATGGSPSGPGGTVNSALTLVAALGLCSNVTNQTFVQVNEISTIAAAYALAPFASDILHIGAPGSNPSGLVGAFANAAVLNNLAAGSAGGAALATGVSVPVNEINTLGDILAACVNTTGATSSGCVKLFGATGATETFGAALAIAKNPGASAITGLYVLATPAAPFQPSMSGSAPNDFTIAVTSTAAANLSTPYGIAIDASGNAWVTNESGNTYTQISAAGGFVNAYSPAGLYGAQGIAIDQNGAVWVANTAGNSVIKQTFSGGNVATTNTLTTGVTAPSAIAVDSAGKAYVANFNGNSVTGFTSAGAVLSGSPFTGNGNITVPTAIAIGPLGNVFVTSGSGSIVRLTNAGVYTSSFNDGTIQGPAGVAVDTTGRVFETGFTTGTVIGGALSQYAATTNVAVASSPNVAGLSTPAGVASDGTSIFVANSVTGGGLGQFAYGSTTSISPSTGYGSLNAPQGVAIDATGSVWTTNTGTNTISKFIGLAAPVTTPLAANVGP